MKRESGIYLIANLTTHRVYIGSAVDTYTRLCVHLSKLRSNTHHSAKLQNSWNKHGPGTFVCAVIEVVANPLHLANREQYWIDKLDSAKGGYNVLPNARTTIGAKLSEDTKRKIGLSNSGRVRSPEHVARMSEVRIGARHSDQTKEKLRIASTGKRQSEEVKALLRAKATGRKQSPETIEKRVSKLRGRKLSAEHIAKSAASRLGGKRSHDSKKRMSVAQAEVIRRSPLERDALGRILPRAKPC